MVKWYYRGDDANLNDRNDVTLDFNAINLKYELIKNEHTRVRWLGLEQTS